MFVLKIILLLIIVSVYMKTEKALPVAIVWGVISIVFHTSNGWLATIFIGFVSFLIAFGVFKLTEYFESDMLFRMMTLVFGMVAMLLF